MAMIIFPLDLQFLFICILSAFAVQFLININRKVERKMNHRHPPTPPAWPIIGHSHLLTRSLLHHCLQKLASRYGPFMLIRAGAVTQYVVSNGAIAKELFKTNDIKFATRPEFGSSDYLIYNDTLFSTQDYGKYWIFLKKICMTEVLSAQSINRFADVRKEELMKLVEVVANCSKKGEACHMGAEFMTMTNNLICRMAMSTRTSGSANESQEIRDVAKGITLYSGLLSLGEAFPLIKKYDLFGSGRKIKAILMKFDALMDTIILKHEVEFLDVKRERKDVMHYLLKYTRDKTDSAEVKLTKKGIKGLFLDLFIGGTDTTSVALEWALAELLNHPNVMKKLQDEINSNVGLNRLVQESDLPNLPYLNAVVKETLRLHPSLPLIFRKCREDCKINGYDIAKDSRILVNLYAINRDPGIWQNATVYIPERFLTNPINPVDHEDQEDMKDQDFNYVPFGGGRRGCPGAALATAVLHITLATLVQCFDWKIKGSEKVNMEEGAGFSAAMAHPLVCYPILRINPSKLT